MFDEPQDLKKRYLSLARCIQAAAMKQRGVAVISINIVVDASGNPHYWTSPEVTKIEPASSDELVKMLVSKQKSVDMIPAG